MKRWIQSSAVIITVLGFSSLMLLGSSIAGTIKVPNDQTTITKALDSAKKGDTIQVAQGTYVEHISLKSGVTLEGGWAKDFSKRDVKAFETTIDGKGEEGYVVFGADDAILDGFTIINATRKVISNNQTVGSGIYCKDSSPRLINNVFRNNEPAGIYGNNSKAYIENNIIENNKEAGIFLEKGSSLTIIGNIIRNNNWAGISAGDKEENKPNSKIDARQNTIYKNGKAGIDAASGTGVIYNNVIYKNVEAGIRLWIGPIEVINNTVVDNGRTGIQTINPELVPVIKNNITAYNYEAGIRSPMGGYSHNLLFSNNGSGVCNPEYLWCVKFQFGGYEDEEHYLKDKNIIADPLFVDRDNDNYRLKGNSPAIDAGDSDKKFNDVNFAPSLGSETNDMGAYGGPYAVAEERKGNEMPVAVIVTEGDYYGGDRVKLDGRESKDPDGDSITYEWKIATKPEGSKATFKKSDKVKATFKADKSGDYEVELVVTDRLGKSSSPNVSKIHVSGNHPPQASVGEVLSKVKKGDTVTMYGSGSKDEDNDPLVYKWELIYRPEGSNAAFADPGAVNSSFQVDALGSYAVQLTVNDGKVDSDPKVVYVSTGHKASGGKRNVPAEYPTIQTAVDAADPGDDIVVQKGVYPENVVIDKNVNLIGVDWPVINGGNKKGNTNSVMFAYLGDSAGKIEGFDITGGGLGGLGHGINIWDSSPEVFNNRIHDNHHNGIGIHGRGTLTSKTKVHNNLIHDNGLGIGNGLGSNAHIYNNRIYQNRIVGVGCRGLSLPRIDGNYIYENHLGIGVREVSIPSIENNHVFNNIDTGIAIGPVSTIKKFAGEDITIKNNLVYGNGRAGIAITNFNMSKIYILNNTIDSNNKLERAERAGGLVLGWPDAAEFTVVVENNIISRNKDGGLSNYTGQEGFPAKGATIINSNNNIWGNGIDYEGSKPGQNEISKDPMFTSVASATDGDYFLGSGSPCLDAGSKSATELGLDEKTAKSDKSGDQGKVDIGYHYPKTELKFIEKE